MPRRVAAVAPIVAAAAIGLAWFVWIGAGRTLSPTSIAWAMVDDWSTHLLGWLFFRNEPPALPLGRISGLLYPVGTTLGYTDSTPWLGLLIRPFSALLPAEFQYIGPWLGACFAGMGVVGFLVARGSSRSLAFQLLGAALFAMTPTLLHRIGHPSLCAHALIVALLWLNVRAYADAAAVKRAVWITLGINLAGVGIHPYLEVMLAALTVALFVRLRWIDRTLSWRGFGAALGVLGFTCAAASYLFGYLGRDVSLGTGGFGAFSADLLALVGSEGWSRLFPDPGHGPGQYEGFSYLGAGILLLDVALAIALALRWRDARRLPWARAVPVVLVALGFAFYSLSCTVTFAGQPVLQLNWLYDRVPGVTSAFRSSGRFIWPLQYLAFIAPVVLLPRLWAARARWVPLAALGAAAALQFADLDPAGVSARFKPAAQLHEPSPAWAAAAAGYKHLALFPPEIYGTPCEALRGYHGALLVQLAYVAYRHHLTFNSAYVARTSPENVRACQRTLDEVERGELDPSTVYVTWPELRPLFERAGATCGLVDGMVTCARPADQGR